ncbi:TlpA disulfide reductase family protein [Saccharothrix coeruleofusca]|uniref:Thioredoxin domain-containing protein n=1 Tax=Saccharothrix coeruleofusca TaxID=33919 RepID=A0A918AJW9_9PSEU|nr:TlpA disulfide reductase family protein [Saccharothrix coeruleofusca]GGP36256.1 hypothetical protein GCM10010185_04170 [Saccharothrix coeruleofusca]
MSSAARWSVVVLVLAIAGVVALWPRTPDEPTPEVPRSQRTTASPEDVRQARDRAALRPCPRGEGGPPQLRGVTAVCMSDGGTVDVASALSGRALVNFWAPWCVPCREELRVLDEYARQPGSVPVLAVQVRSKEEDGLELLADLGVRLPSVVDEADAVRRALHAPNALPASVVLAADGSSRLVTDPTVFTSVEQVREVVG